MDAIPYCVSSGSCHRVGEDGRRWRQVSWQLNGRSPSARYLGAEAGGRPGYLAILARSLVANPGFRGDTWGPELRWLQ